MSHGSCNLTADEALERLRQGNARYLNASHAQGDVSPELRQSTFREGSTRTPLCWRARIRV